MKRKIPKRTSEEIARSEELRARATKRIEERKAAETQAAERRASS